jgi:5,10-methylenetetrahydrofolate reductase
VTFNQYAAEQPKSMSNLVAKLSAGAAYIQTQPVFAPQGFLETVRAIRREHPDIPVVPMVLPLLTPEAVDRIQRRLRITIPLEYRAAVAEGPERAWDAFAGVVSGLVSSGEVNGLAVMTFQMDAAAEDGRHIARLLFEAGVRRAAPAARA